MKYNEYKQKISELYLSYKRSGYLAIDEFISLKQDLLQANFYDLYGYCFYILAMHYLHNHQNNSFEEILNEIKAIKNNPFIEVFSHILLSLHSYYVEQDFNKPLQYMKKSQSILSKNNITDSLTNYLVLFLLGVIYCERHEFDNATKCLKKATKIKMNESDEFLRIDSYKQLGIVERLRNEPARAIKYFISCKQLYEQHHMEIDYSDTLVLLGLVYSDYEKPNIAMSHYKHALQISKKYDWQEVTANINNNMGLIYLDKNELSQAEDCFKESIEYRKNNPNIIGMAIAKANLAMVYLKMELPAEALHLYQNALELAKNMKFKNIRLIIMLNIRIFNTLMKQGDYKKAIKNLRTAEKLNQKLDNKEVRKDIFECYVTYYAYLKRYKKALDYACKEKELQAEITAENIKNIYRILQEKKRME